MKTFLTGIAVLFNLYGYSQVSRYSEPAQLPTNQQYYSLPYNELNQALESRQREYNEVINKLNYLEQRCYDLKNIRGADAQLKNDMDANIATIEFAMTKNVSMQTYYTLRKLIEEDYNSFLERNP